MVEGLLENDTPPLTCALCIAGEGGEKIFTSSSELKGRVRVPLALDFPFRKEKEGQGEREGGTDRFQAIQRKEAVLAFPATLLVRGEGKGRLSHCSKPPREEGKGSH